MTIHLLKISEKEKMLKGAREKKTFRGTKNENANKFLTDNASKR